MPDEETVDQETEEDAEEERPSHKETIHGHPVYCDDQEVRRYLKKLDRDEAQAIFNYAKVHGRTDFEMKKPGSSARWNCNMAYDDGAYIVEVEGKEKTGWF
jgi:hypothetical protein